LVEAWGVTPVNSARDDAVDKLSDPELVRLLVAGNHDAMTVIFDRYWRLVMSVALHILHDVAEAEDLVQIVFTEFYQRAELFDESKGNLRTWLLQYSYGRSFNQKKKLRAHGFFEPVEAEEVENRERSDGSQSVSRVEGQDAAILVGQILPRLTGKQRDVIQMAFFEGMKLSEVALRTGEPVGNVRHAYYRGIEKLRSLLGPASKQRSDDGSFAGLQMSWLRRPRKDSQPLTREVDIA
jgi:RNA polymerase sigma-70 factor, ECF subfamily